MHDFRLWLFSQRDRNDRVGSLARELEQNPCAGCCPGVAEMVRHIARCHNGNSTAEALGRAVAEYVAFENTEGETEEA